MLTQNTSLYVNLISAGQKFAPEAQVSFEEFRRFAVLLPERQLAKERILATWIDSADWMEGVEYRCGRRLSTLFSHQCIGVPLGVS